MQLTHGSLFSGIGGFDIAAQRLKWHNKFHCEINRFGKLVLKHYWSNAESYNNITETNFVKWNGLIDVVSGGFPCQDASLAGGGQRGLQGKRTGLLFQMLRAIEEIQPKFVVAENVSNFLKVNGGADFSTVLTELSRLGYNAEWRTCYAAEVGAPHKRSRLYLVAYPNSIRLQKGETFFSNVHETTSPICWNAYGTAIPLIRGGEWCSEPPIACLDNGIPSKLAGFTNGQYQSESLKAYGNAVVPQIAFAIFKAIHQYQSAS